MVITSHISGGYSLKRVYENIIELCINNFNSFVSREKMTNVINRNRGY